MFSYMVKCFFSFETKGHNGSLMLYGPVSPYHLEISLLCFYWFVCVSLTSKTFMTSKFV